MPENKARARARVQMSDAMLYAASVAVSKAATAEVNTLANHLLLLVSFLFLRSDPSHSHTPLPLSLSTRLPVLTLYTACPFAILFSTHSFFAYAHLHHQMHTNNNPLVLPADPAFDCAPINTHKESNQKDLYTHKHAPWQRVNSHYVCAATQAHKCSATTAMAGRA